MTIPTRPDRRRQKQRRARLRAGRVLRGSSAAVLLAVLVAGVPWALARYVGWPLPDRFPTATELQLHLFSPLSSGLLLDVLACACWLAWAAFTLDVARCTAALVARGAGSVRVSGRMRLSPTHALAAVLVGTVALSIIGNRVAARDARSAAFAWPVVQTVGPDRPGPVPLVPVAFTVPDRSGTVHTGTYAGPDSARSVVVRVPDPVTGVHDSLWRIAGRTLGDGTRWPEIFEINRGKPQPGGGTFTRPSLIFPGEELVLPLGNISDVPEQQSPADIEVPTPTPQPGSIEPSTPDTSGPSGPPAREPAGAGERPDPRDSAPALVWDPVAFAGIGLAAAVSTALITVRRRRRRAYRPGSGRRDDLPAAPIVYQLRLAHLRADQPEPDEPDPEAETGPDDDRESGCDEDDQPAGAGTRSGPPTLTAGEATSGAQRIALAAASTRGLGLTGLGAPSALRALLLTLLAGAEDDCADLEEGGPAVRLLVSREDIAGVLGTAAGLLAAVEVHDTLDSALDVLESESIARAAHPPPDHPAPVLVLVARVDGDNARLQAVLDNGSEFGVTALLLGQWRSGGTVHVRRDGTVTATGPGPCTALRGSRLLTLDRDSAGRIVELLHAASVTDGPDRSFVGPGPHITGEATESSLEIGPLSTDEQDGPPPSALDPPPPAPVHTGRPAAQDVVLPLRLVVLGRPRMLWHPSGDPDSQEPHGIEAEVEITGRLQPRARELLVHLALHPDGVGRESVAAALWPASAPDRTTNALNTALTRLRQTLTQVTGGEVGDVVRNWDGRLTLDPELVDVDYWRFDAAVTARRAAGTDDERIDADQLVVDAYGGELAEGTPYAWIEIAREAVRRDAIDSAAAFARALVPRDPQRTLDLLEIARAFDPVNEMIYRDIMRLQSRLGRTDAISRTLALLTARLGELGDRPNADTIDLARRLQMRGDAEQHGSRGTDDGGDAIPGSAARAG